MTWINDIERDIESSYSITPHIVENYKTRYRRYNHRAVFYLVEHADEKADHVEDLFKGTSFSHYTFGRHDWRKATQLRSALLAKLGNTAKLRNEWIETFVYFEDVNDFLKAVPKDLLQYLRKLELMAPGAVSAKQNFSHDYPVELTVKPRLPFDKYRYRIYTATSSKVRRSIGTENLLSIHGSLKAYEGIYIPDRFERYVERHWNPDTYFYSETLDWLPLIYMMDPRYIKRIEQFKTSKELEQDDTTA